MGKDPENKSQDIVRSLDLKLDDITQKIKELPGPVARYFRFHIPSMVAEIPYYHLTFRGRIKLVNWSFFRANLWVSPSRGFLWQGKISLGVLPVKGYDYLNGQMALSDWKLFNIIPVVRASDENTIKSFLGRLKIESLFFPYFLFHSDVEWAVESDSELLARWINMPDDQPLKLTIGQDGRLESATVLRWGNPGGTPTWDYHPFGITVTQYKKINGIMVPSEGIMGWWPGTSQSDDGIMMFFKVL